MASYNGTYRIAYEPDGQRFLEVRRSTGYVRIDKPLPTWVRGSYAAANFLKV